MNVLVFGHSGSTENRDRATARGWVEMVGDDLSAALSEPVTIQNRRLYPYIPGSADYVGSEIGKRTPDVVIIQAAASTFSVPWVQLRIRDRLGDRPADAFLGAVRAFDRQTITRGGTALKFNRAARVVAHKALGSRPLTTREEVTEGYLAVIRRLAQEEHLRVIVIGSTRHGSWLRKRFPQVGPEATELNRVLSAACHEHHFEFIDGAEVVERLADPDTAYLADGDTRSPVGHRALADEVVRVVAASS